MVTDDSYESSRLDHDCGQGESSTNDDDISMGCCCDSSRVSASSTAADANDLVGVDDDDEGGSGGDGGEAEPSAGEIHVHGGGSMPAAATTSKCPLHTRATRVRRRGSADNMDQPSLFGHFEVPA